MSKWISKPWTMPSVKTDPPVERFLKMIYSPEVNDYQQATILFSYIPPGSTSGLHNHPDNDEIMYFTGRGEGTLGDEEIEIENDLVMVAPKGIPHEVRNTSDTETIKILCIYIPPLKPAEIHEKSIRLSKKWLAEMNV